MLSTQTYLFANTHDILQKEFVVSLPSGKKIGKISNFTKLQDCDMNIPHCNIHYPEIYDNTDNTIIHMIDNFTIYINLTPDPNMQKKDFIFLIEIFKQDPEILSIGIYDIKIFKLNRSDLNNDIIIQDYINLFTTSQIMRLNITLCATAWYRVNLICGR